METMLTCVPLTKIDEKERVNTNSKRDALNDSVKWLLCSSNGFPSVRLHSSYTKRQSLSRSVLEQQEMFIH